MTLLFQGLKLEGRWLFLRVLVLVFTRIWVYRGFYLKDFYLMGYYKCLILWFLGRIVGLLFRSSGLFFLVSWDILGLRSFFLVLLYLNWDAFSGSVVTVLTNRLGDYFLLLLVLVGGTLAGFRMLARSCSWLVLLGASTKRAQWPFIGWLPKAMRAPTPVSALVHRSTLVTAGLVLLFLVRRGFTRVLRWIFFLGLVRIALASTLAVYEKDAKKLVALRTLSQVGLCFLAVGLQYWFIGLFHTLSHALYKRLLFLQVGSLIYTT